MRSREAALLVEAFRLAQAVDDVLEAIDEGEDPDVDALRGRLGAFDALATAAGYDVPGDRRAVSRTP